MAQRLTVSTTFVGSIRFRGKKYIMYMHSIHFFSLWYNSVGMPIS